MSKKLVGTSLGVGHNPSPRTGLIKLPKYDEDQSSPALQINQAIIHRSLINCHDLLSIFEQISTLPAVSHKNEKKKHPARLLKPICL